MRHIEMKIEGMSCGHCLKAVRETLEGIPGVEIEQLDLGNARVAYDEERAEPEDIARAVDEAGYPSGWREA